MMPVEDNKLMASKDKCKIVINLNVNKILIKDATFVVAKRKKLEKIQYFWIFFLDF